MIICGIETHACIQGTVQDLLERDYNTIVVVDGCSSNHLVNRFSAFREMENIGARLATSEQVKKQKNSHCYALSDNVPYIKNVYLRNLSYRLRGLLAHIS